VRDDEHCFPHRRLDAAELAVQFGAGDGIKCSERLVHQQHGRIDGESARDSDALPLAAGQLVGHPRRIFVGCEIDQRQQFARARHDARLGPPFQRGNDAHVARHVHVREQTHLLQHITGAPSQLDGTPLSRVAAVDDNAAAHRIQQPHDEPQRGALAGAAPPHQRHRLPALDRKRHAVQHQPRRGGRRVRHLIKRNHPIATLAFHPIGDTGI
jgi:hypothetical protein